MRYRSLLTAVLICSAAAWTFAEELTPIEQLGKHLFFDTALSAPQKMGCVTCHAPEAGWTSPEEDLNLDFGVYHGAVEPRFGNRKIPTSAYAGEVPPLHKVMEDDEVLWVGGLFWDGRATGWEVDPATGEITLTGDPLVEQAMGPFLNPLEHNLPSAKQLVRRVSLSSYAYLFEEAFGKKLDPKDVNASFMMIAEAIAAYERSKEVNPFSSKYDLYLAGEVELTEQESRGLRLFDGRGVCSSCHPMEMRVVLDDAGNEVELPPLFTDFTYDNLGLPKNPDNPFYKQPKKFNPDGVHWIDRGLGGFLKSAGFDEEVWAPEVGKHRVPTLRNVDLRPYEGFVKAYGHNGVFKSLEDIVHFYNTRDIPEFGWDAPEVPETVNDTELGDLGLSEDDEAAIVAFLKTLSDGYQPPLPAD
jgi:cytochrome c peroxidase